MKVDIYDFDKTMVPFDSGSLFWGYCILHYPWIVSCMPYQFVGGLLFILGIDDLTKMKKFFFSFIKMIPIDKAVCDFWDKHEKDINEWAKKENRERYSVMISASPDFLIQEIAKRIEIDDFLCTLHDRKNGAVIGINCHDDEKVRRFREKYPDAEVECVYSDSIRSDKPIFALGKKCYQIVKRKKIPFIFNEVYKK